MKQERSPINGLIQTKSEPSHDAPGSLGELEQLLVVLIDETTVIQVLAVVGGCERCSENATLPFDYLLDGFTGSDPTVTEYMMHKPGKCPNCNEPITEKTLVLAS